jgi:hypothetical protein
LPHFEISIKLRIFGTHVDPSEKERKKLTLLYFVSFSFFVPQKLISVLEDMNKVKRPLYLPVSLRILLLIQIQFLEIENTKNPKIDSPIE